MVNSGNVQGGLSFLQLASQKAVAKQDAKRLYEIGAFFEGHGKINAAVPLYKAGAMLGHPGCQFNLGIYYIIYIIRIIVFFFFFWLLFIIIKN